MRRPSFSQIMAALLLIERAHSTLAEFLPNYSDFTSNFTRRLKKRLGLSQSLHDKVVAYLCTDDIIEGKIKTDHSIQDGPLWAFFKENIIPIRVLNLKDESDGVSLADVADLDGIPLSSLIEVEPDSIIVRKFIAKPACAENTDDQTGLCPYLLTFAEYKNRPIILQIRGDDDGDRDYTIVDFLVGADDKGLFEELSKDAKKFIKENSPLRGWVVSCEDDEMGNLAFEFEEDLCKKLRSKKYEFDIKLYNSDIQNLITRDISNFIKKQDKLCLDGYDGRRAYLLEGPPGTGKSDIIRSIISILPERYTTIILNEKNMYELRALKRRKFLFPALVVIEDIDLLVTSKNKWQILLNFLDGFNAPDKIITVMTSNNKAALLGSIINRPGRIDRPIYVGPGTEEQRVAQLTALTRGICLPPDVDINALAKVTDGYTIAQLRELIRRAAIYTPDSNKNISAEAIKTVLEEFDRQRKETSNAKLTFDDEQIDEDPRVELKSSGRLRLNRRS